jgi:hypothetical protein
MQLVSLYNHFLNSSYDQSGDLNEFECTKFVHVLTLMFLDSKVFYMFIGFHRLKFMILDTQNKRYELFGV